ncbi:hypothetical protein [Pararhodobacter sp.]|uniref:hypothetical protein n=1 Tax=Pararhodobacter sp. TaxID=2127056 RepID=UPI002AFEDE03|nr:hypothetical protein [Pararhodobacter sp.]
MIIAADRYRHVLLGIVVLGAVLRIMGLNWDAGRGLHPDEGNLIRAALTLGVNGRMLPEFHAYNDLALWLPRLLSVPFCASDNAACLTLVARALSAALSLAMVPLGAGLAMRMAGPVAGLAAALALATSGQLIQWAHFGTTESAIAMMVLLLWWLAARWQAGEMPDRHMAVWSAMVLGIGFGFKTTAVVLSIIPLMAFALAGRPDAARLRTILAFGAIAAVQAVAFAPSVIFATRAWLDVMDFENSVVTGSLPVFWTAQFHGTTDILYELSQLWSLTSGAGVLLAVVGLILLPRTQWRIVAPGLAFALVYAALTFGWHAKFIRYLAPLLPVVLVLGGVALGRLATLTLGRTGFAVGLAGLGLMVLAGLDSAAAYLRPDPRIAVETQLLALSSEGDVVAIEPRDLPQSGGLPQVVLPLNDAPLSLAEPLATADWLLIASRRNYEVLPRQPGAAPGLCAYYAGLADGSLGFVPVLRADRLGPLGRLFAPGLTAEETRTVFDRPEVFLFRNIDRLSAQDLDTRLRTPRDAEACDPQTLQRLWRRGP